jgi:hypothetical protein
MSLFYKIAHVAAFVTGISIGFYSLNFFYYRVQEKVEEEPQIIHISEVEVGGQGKQGGEKESSRRATTKNQGS